MALRRILICEPHLETAHLLETLCAQYRRTHVVSGLHAAQRRLENIHRWAALITELDFSTGDGAEFVSATRQALPSLPILVLTSTATPQTINYMNRLRVAYHCKPTRRAWLRGFLSKAVARDRVGDDRLATYVNALSQRRQLTPREHEILAASVGGVSRRTLQDQIGTTANTLKTQVRSLLRKCQSGSLDELVRTILNDALLLGDHDTYDFVPPSSVPTDARDLTIQPPDEA